MTRVWSVVNDPSVLKLCVPGCQDIRVVDANTFTAKAVVKVGFISSKFDSILVKKVQAVENQQLVLDITGEDANKVGGFRLNMEVKLANVPDEPSKTSLEINATVDMRGKFATLGKRIVEWKAKGMMEEFVANLKKLPG